MTNHAAVLNLLMVRKTSFYRPCCFRHDQYVLGYQCWAENVLFPQHSSSYSPSQTSKHQGEKQAKNVTSRMSSSDHGFDAICYLGDDQRGVHDGIVRLSGRENYTIQVARVCDTALEDIFMPRVPVSYTTGGGKRAKYTLAAGLHDNIVVAQYRFLTRYI